MISSRLVVVFDAPPVERDAPFREEDFFEPPRSAARTAVATRETAVPRLPPLFDDFVEERARFAGDDFFGEDFFVDAFFEDDFFVFEVAVLLDVVDFFELLPFFADFEPADLDEVEARFVEALDFFDAAAFFDPAAFFEPPADLFALFDFFEPLLDFVDPLDFFEEPVDFFFEEPLDFFDEVVVAAFFEPALFFEEPALFFEEPELFFFEALFFEDVPEGISTASRLTSLLKRLRRAPDSSNARLLRSNHSKNSSHSIFSSVSSPENPGKSIRSTPGSLRDPVARTRAGWPPRASTHRRISS